MSRVAVAVALLLGGAYVGSVAAAEPGVSPSALPERGAHVYQKWCVPCHGPGRTHPGTLALEAKYQGKIPAELEKRTDLDDVTVKFFVRNGVSVMPFFRKTEISDEDLRALSAYLAKSR